jgi:hypothetical protein
MSPQAAGFARAVVAPVAPAGQERAKNLLWAAGRLADWAAGPGLEPFPQVLLHSSVTGRFTAHAPGLPGPARRTLRTDLRFIARQAVPALAPADAPLPREPPHHGSSDCAGPEASWGHRNSSLPGPKGEMFSGCYFPAATMTRDEDGPPVPELTRRITLSPCHAGPVRALTPVITRTPRNGIPPGGILAGSGYACRDADARALPLRAAGAQLVQDPHPAGRGPQGTVHGAIIANGSLYCPATPGPLLHLGPPAPAATPGDTAAHDIRTAGPAVWRTASPAGSPPMTPTGTTASPAPPPRGRSAARYTRTP